MPQIDPPHTALVIVDASHDCNDRQLSLVVEILSPRYSWAKVTRRITQFLGRGVAVVWLVDPEGRSVTVYRSNQLPQVYEGADEPKGEPELPDFACRIADLFYLPGEEAPAGTAGQG
jgi:Uma2 family endonuclease